AALQAALAEATDPQQRVAVVAQGQPLSGVVGFFNCLRLEPGPGRLNLRCYFLPDEGSEPFSADAPVFRRRLELDLVMNVLEGGRWGSFRHTPIPRARCVTQATHAYNDQITPGDLSSFAWFKGPFDPVNPLLPEGHTLMHVYYSSFNFKDIMIASGKLNTSTLPHVPGRNGRAI
ncbi:Uncharacterized protein GBIM_17572, partial [Gryllus bimaculatus]